MDSVSYRQILDARGEEPMKQEHGEYKYIIAFRSDLLRDKLVWANKWQTDWHNYMKVKHSLYGVFKAPRCDAYTGTERAIVLFLGVGLAAIWSITMMCCISMFHYGGYTLSEYVNTGAFSGLDIRIILSLVGAVVKFAANTTLQMLATCGPCQKGCCLIFRGLFECLGQCLMFVWSVIIVILLITLIALAAAQDILVDFLEMFVMMTIFSWFITDVIILSITFWVGYGNEKKNKNGRLSRLAVDYIEYEFYVNERDPEYIVEIVNKLIVPRKQRNKVPSSLELMIKIKMGNKHHLAHGIDVAMHNLAICCRDCLYRWHRIKKSEILTEDKMDEITDFAVDYINDWILNGSESMKVFMSEIQKESMDDIFKKNDQCHVCLKRSCAQKRRSEQNIDIDPTKRRLE